MVSPSPIAMRLSLFRSKSNTSNPEAGPPKRRLSAMWTPTRSKTEHASRSDSHIIPHPDAGTSNAVAYSTASASIASTSNGGTSGSPTISVPTSYTSRAKVQTTATSDIASDPVNAHNESSRIDERDMMRKLMDVESSFLPDAAHTSSSPSKSRQGPYQAAAQPRSRPPLLDGDQTHVLETSPQKSTFSGSYPTSPASTRSARTPQTARLQMHRNIVPAEADGWLDYDDSPHGHLSSLNTMSSPTAAVAQRSRTRASAAPGPARSSWQSYATQQHSTTGTERRTEIPETPDHQIRETTRSSSRQGGAEEGVNESRPYQPLVSDEPIQDSSKHSRQRSTASSYLSDPQSEVTVGAESGRQSGTTTAGRGSASIRPSEELSRLPSFGSMASSISGGTEMNGTRGKKRTANGTLLPPRQEAYADHGAVPDRDNSETPRAAGYDSIQPTDTVLAQRVRDVEVPDTVARQFRAANQEVNEAKPLMSTPYYGRGRNNLTLKEQNSKIDKLTKENFDLKLKIHYLHQALQDRSDEGVKDLTSHNAQLQADLVNAKKDNQLLRKRVKVLEKNQNGQGISPSGSYRDSEEDKSTRSNVQAQMEDEIHYLRERMHQVENENQRLTKAALTRATSGASVGQQDALREALERESSRRNRAEQQVQDLREELDSFKQSNSAARRLRVQSSEASMKNAGAARQTAESELDHGSLSGATLVEQLRQENADLRRDLGAQTSMLTSRNRERERLQQEIEDLKIVQRRGDVDRSVSGDSILDRSVSRNNYRSTSRASGSVRLSQMSDNDREHYEGLHAALRDENAMLKLRNQDLQRELNEQRDNAEYLQTLENNGETTAQELEQARAEIEYMEELVLQKEDDIAQLASEVRGREEEADALQLEIKAIGDSLNRLVDDSEANQTTIQNLQQDLMNANGELEGLEDTLRDTAEAKERLEVQAESSQNEISFLREEQESDKIRISELQAALRSVQTNLSGEKERVKAFEELEADAAKAKEEARRLRKSLSSMEAEASSAKTRHTEIETGLRKAFGKPEARGPALVQEVARIREQLETTLEDLENARFDLSDKDRLLNDRESLLETSSNENRRLNDILARERQGRQHDRNEFERIQRTGPQARLAELEKARAEDKDKVVTLQQSFSTEVRQRNELLFSIWSRLSELCGPEWLQRHGLDGDQDSKLTADNISKNLPTFNKNIILAVKTIERVIASFRARLRGTEAEILKEYQALEQALELRTTRLDNLERALQQGTPNESSKEKADDPRLAEYANRLKHENKMLRRELKFLKQGGFALPGLPSPPIVDRTRDADIGGPPPFVHSSSASAVPQRKSSKNAHSSARGFGITPYESSVGHISLDAGQESETLKSPGGAHSSTSNDEEVFHDTQQEQVPSLANDRSSATAAGAAAPDKQLGLTAPYSTATAVALSDEQQDAHVAPSEQRWVLRLEELKRRLQHEREGRLIDREGAMQRLHQGKEEIDGLKKELERERGRARSRTKMSEATAESTAAHGNTDEVD